MLLTCINNWINNPGCCTKDATSELFMGIRITEGVSILAEFRSPFRAWIGGGKLFIYADRKEHIFHLSKFETQDEQAIKDLLYACLNNTYGNELVPAFVEYEVDAGNQNDFAIPIPIDGIQILDQNYYLVFINGIPSSIGVQEFEWTLTPGGNILFTVAILDETPDVEARIISIYYWYKK